MNYLKEFEKLMKEVCSKNSDEKKGIVFNATEFTLGPGEKIFACIVNKGLVDGNDVSDYNKIVFGYAEKRKIERLETRLTLYHKSSEWYNDKQIVEIVSISGDGQIEFRDGDGRIRKKKFNLP